MTAAASVRPITSDLLLVGSLPADSTEEALRAGAEFFGDLVFALPDGETGARIGWVGYDRTSLLRANPEIEVLPGKPMALAVPPPFDEVLTIFKIKDGVEELHFDSWARIDDALESWKRFKTLRDEGVIPAGTRFQIGLPFPTDVLSGFGADFAHDYPIAVKAYEDLFAREIKRLLAEIPAEDLALQWDVCIEVLDIEGVVSWIGDEGAWERFTGPVQRMTPLIPEDVLVGYHLCYGTFPDWPIYEARDYALLVKMANFAVANSGRPVDWLHMAGPKPFRSGEDRFFAPLADLDIGDARVFLGIVLPADGAQGLQVRHATASKYLDDFGVAMYCGFGRQPGQDGRQTMKTHRETVTGVVGVPAG